MQIIEFQEQYIAEMCNLFHDAIHAIDPSIYTKAQQFVWRSTLPDYQSWKEHVQQKNTWLAISNGNVMGFIIFMDEGYIDCLYVHPTFQCIGVATALYEHILLIAKQKKIKMLSVDASKVACHLFEKWGFLIKKINNIARDGEIITNFHMEKIID